MSLIDTIKKALGFKQALPTYQAPQASYTPPPQIVSAQNIPTYTPPPEENQALSGLQGVISRNLSQIQGGQLQLPDNQRQAIMGQATRSANEEADRGNERIAESLNAQGLGGSSAHGTALAENERQRQIHVGDAADRVTQAEMGLDQHLYDSTMDSGNRILSLLQQRGQNQQAAGQFGFNAMNTMQNTANDNAYKTFTTGSDNAYKTYESQAKAEEDQGNRLTNLMSLAALRFGKV